MPMVKANNFLIALSQLFVGEVVILKNYKK